MKDLGSLHQLRLQKHHHTINDQSLYSILLWYCCYTNHIIHVIISASSLETKKIKNKWIRTTPTYRKGHFFMSFKVVVLVYTTWTPKTIEPVSISAFSQNQTLPSILQFSYSAAKCQEDKKKHNVLCLNIRQLSCGYNYFLQQNMIMFQNIILNMD